MDLDAAWKVLGRDLEEILSVARAIPRKDRLRYLEDCLEGARRSAKTLMVHHHPDRGGDAKLFKEVNEALAIIESHTTSARTESAGRTPSETKRSVFIKLDDGEGQGQDS